MTDLSDQDRVLAVLGLVRTARRTYTAATRQRLVDALRDQHTLVVDLSRADLELVVYALSGLAATLVTRYADVTSDNVEELLDQLVRDVVNGADDDREGDDD
jgi:hypothetical protein